MTVHVIKKPLKVHDVSGRVAVFAYVILMYLLLSACYETVVAPEFNFGGFTLEPRFFPIVEYALIFCLALFMPKGIRTSKQMFSWISVIFLLIPATVLSALQSADRAFLVLMYAATFYVVGLAHFFGRAVHFTSRERHVLSTLSGPVKILLIFAILVMVGLWVQSPGIKTFSFSDVYDHRFDFNDSLAFPMTYLVPIAGNAISPFLMAFAVTARRPLLAIFAVGFGIVLFGMTTHKVFAFAPIFALVWVLLVKFRFGLHILLSSLLVLILMTMLVAESDITILGNSFANRLMFIPAQIHYEYMKVFSDIGFQFWAESKIGLGLAISNLQMPAVNFVGERMTGNADIGANTGWIANAFMNAGVAGLFIYGLIIAILLMAIDRWSFRYSPEFVLGAFSIFLLSIVNSMDLFVTVFTGGAGVLFLFFITAEKLYFGDSRRPHDALKPKVCSSKGCQ